jgi:hypothetical protein
MILISNKFLFGNYKKSILKKLLSTSTVTISSVLMMPLALIIMREVLKSGFNEVIVGNIQALFTLGLITSSLYIKFFDIYIFPRFSKEGMQIIKNTSRFGFVAFIFILPLIIFFNNEIVTIIFSSEYTYTAQYLKYQYLSEFLKFNISLYGILLILHGKNLLAIIINLSSLVLLLISSYIAVTAQNLSLFFILNIIFNCFMLLWLRIQTKNV